MRFERLGIRGSLEFQIITDGIKGRRVGVTIAVIDVILPMLETNLVFASNREMGRIETLIK